MEIKRLFRNIAAALSAAVMLFSTSVSAFGEGASSRLPYAGTLLPSGSTVEEFDEAMNAIAAENSNDHYAFASASVGIFKGDETIYTGYFGKVNYADDIPADENSVYEWGSISKTLIWVSAMQLWEEGRLDLDRDVREYLPEGFFGHLSYDDPITFRNLMDHNAGWQETTRSIFKDKKDPILPLGEALKSIEPAQVSRPGETVAYSNYGAAVAGYVIECITGMDYCRYVRENIFEPLGMEHTSIAPDHTDNQWVRQQREKSRSYQVMMDGLTDMGKKDLTVLPYPAGSVQGTLDDLMTYGKALADDDAPLFRSRETQEKLFSGSLFYGESNIPMWSYGFGCIEYGVRVYGHSGGTQFGQANLIFDRESGTGLVIFVNEQNGNKFLFSAPEACFGTLSPDKYSIGSSETFDVSGRDLLTSRAWHKGMMKYYTLLSAPSLTGKAEKIGEGAYQITSDGSAFLIGIKTAPDGGISIQQPSFEAFSVRGYLARLLLITAYLISAAAAFYMLRIDRKLKKSAAFRSERPGALMKASYRARLISGLLFLSTVVIFSRYNGIELPTAAAMGITQAVCGAVCAAAAVWAAVRAAKKKDKRLRFLLSIVGNLLCTVTILCFDLYLFTGV